MELNKRKMLKIKKKNNDTILGVAKNELKRLGNAYTDNIASQIKISDLSPDIRGEPSEINWEEMANKVNSFKIRLLKDRLSFKDRPRKLLNSTKRRSFKIKPKEERKDGDKLSTLELCAQVDNDIEDEKLISNQLDIMLNEDHQTPIINQPLSIESNCANFVNERFSMKDNESKPSNSSIAQVKIEANSGNGVRFKSICKKPQNLFAGATLNKRVSKNRLRKNNVERNNLIQKMNNQGNQAIKHFSRTESTSKIVIDQSELKLETRMPSFKGNKTPYINSDSKKFTKSIYKCDFGDTVMSNYLQEDTKFQLPSAVKSRDNNQLPSERQSEKYL